MSARAQGPTTTAPPSAGTAVPVDPQSTDLPTETIAPGVIAPEPGVTEPPDPLLVDDGGADSGPPAFLVLGLVFFALATVAILVIMLVGRESAPDPVVRRRWIRTLAAVLAVVTLLSVVAVVAAS